MDFALATTIFLTPRVTLGGTLWGVCEVQISCTSSIATPTKAGKSLFLSILGFGGEGGIRTHVPVTRQAAFEAAPLRPLRYLSASGLVLLLADAGRTDLFSHVAGRGGAAGLKKTLQDLAAVVREDA
jgi:hypothetical protein